MNIKLKNVDLSVSNVAVSLEFYTRLLHMTDTAASAPPHMMILSSGAITLSLHQMGTRGGRAVVPGSVEIAFECDDLESVHAAFKADGVTLTNIQTFGFGRSFEAKDPDGYALNFYTLNESSVHN